MADPSATVPFDLEPEIYLELRGSVISVIDSPQNMGVVYFIIGLWAIQRLRTIRTATAIKTASKSSRISNGTGLSQGHRGQLSPYGCRPCRRSNMSLECDDLMVSIARVEGMSGGCELSAEGEGTS